MNKPLILNFLMFIYDQEWHNNALITLALQP